MAGLAESCSADVVGLGEHLEQPVVSTTTCQWVLVAGPGWGSPHHIHGTSFRACHCKLRWPPPRTPHGGPQLPFRGERVAAFKLRRPHTCMAMRSACGRASAASRARYTSSHWRHAVVRSCRRRLIASEVETATGRVEKPGECNSPNSQTQFDVLMCHVQPGVLEQGQPPLRLAPDRPNAHIKRKTSESSSSHLIQRAQHRCKRGRQPALRLLLAWLGGDGAQAAEGVGVVGCARRDGPIGRNRCWFCQQLALQELGSGCRSVGVIGSESK